MGPGVCFGYAGRVNVLDSIDSIDPSDMRRLVKHNPPTACPATDPWWSWCRLSEAAANWVTHGLGLLLALVGAPVLVVLAHRVGSPSHVVAVGVYGLSVILLYTASTRYHLLQDKPGEYARLMTDHICIYFLIAGTYTAICMTVLREQGPWGWAMLAAIWVLAIGGTVFKVIAGLRYARVSLALYIIMGWLAVASLWPLIRSTPVSALVLLLVGGVFYTGGTIFYARVWIGKMRYAHAVWHLAVVAGSVFHYFAIRECLLAVAVA